MKLKLFITAIALAAPSNPIIINADALDLHFAKIGPYYKYQDPCPFFGYDVTSKTIGGGNYTITIMFGDDKVDNRRTIQNNTGDIDYGDKKIFLVQAPTNLCLGDGGMKITFTAVNNNTNKKVVNFNFVIYPKICETINPITISNGKYVSNKTFATKEDKFAITRNEEYDFSGFVDYFLTDTYFALTLDQYSFGRKCVENDFDYKQANLYINGGAKYFPGLSFVDGKSTIPLSLVQNGSTIGISFQKTMYVDPKLLIMSLTPKSGYVATKHFFFPVNHSKELEGLTFTFEILEMGVSGLTARWDASYLAVNGLLGSCQNSEYCVDGELET